MNLASVASVGHMVFVGSETFARELEISLEGWLSELRRFDKPSGVLRYLRSSPSVDAVVLFPKESFESHAQLCRDINFDARTAFLPVVFLLPPALSQRSTEALESGARDCIRLPAPHAEIALRISNAVRAKRMTDSLEDATAVLTSLAVAIEGRDAYTHGHVERVSCYAVEMGKRAGVTESDLLALKYGGIVHDIGKVAIPDSILNKPGRLDDLEMALVKRHPVIGYDILHSSRTFQNVLPVVRWHHERLNGTGYPDALRGDDLPLLPRIVAVADVFDALSTDRPYRQSLPTEICRHVLSGCAERQDLDPRIVAILLDMLKEIAPFETASGAQSAQWMPPSASISAL